MSASRGSTGDGPMAYENRFADSHEHELDDFHQMVAGEHAFVEINEKVGDIWRAITIGRQ